MQQVRIGRRRASAALDVACVPGLDSTIDEAAAAADPRHAFLRRAWFAAAQPAQPITLIARRPDGRVIAALPLGRCGSRWLPLKAVPGCYWPFRSFPIALGTSDAEIVALLRDETARRALGRAWRLGPVCTDDPTASRLVALAEAGGWHVIERPIGASFVLDAGPMHRQGEWPRTTTLRKNRWFEKELAKAGDVGAYFVSGEGWTAETFDTLAAIEGASWIPKETDGSDAKFLAPHHRRFWEAAAADPVLAAMMHASVLTLGSRPVAFNFDIDCGDTRYAIANSYDEQFAKWSPGRVLAYRSLVPAVEAEIERIDWGCGDSGYKRLMGASEAAPIVDLLFVRDRLLATFLRRFWKA